MTIFLILAPYGAYALLMLVTSAAVSLFAAVAVCLGVIALDIVRGRSVKILGAGSGGPGFACRCPARLLAMMGLLTPRG